MIIPVRITKRDNGLLSLRSRKNLNLIVIDRPPRPVIENCLSLCLLNAQSIRNKTADFVDYVRDNKYDLVAITETWLKSKDDAIRVELCPEGYKFIDYPRGRCGGGGIGFLYKDSLVANKVRSGEKESFEYMDLLIRTSSSRKVRIIVIYRQPYSEEHRVSTSTFISEFSDFIDEVILSKEELLILGDFNIHVDVLNDPDGLRFLDLLDSFGLEQHVAGATHIHGHTLDLVITRKAERIVESVPCSGRYFSDHTVIRCNLAISKPRSQAKKVTFRKTKAIDMTCFKQTLSHSDICVNEHAELLNPNDLDTLLHDYNTTLRSVLECHAPLRTKTVKVRTKVPWFNNDIAEAKRQRRKAERTWRRTRSTEDLARFKRMKNRVTYICNKARKEFYTEFFKDNEGDQGKLFKAMKVLLHPKVDLCFPDHLDNTVLANDIGSFFYRKIMTIRGELDAAVIDQGDYDKIMGEPAFKAEKKLETFAVLSRNEVYQLIQRSTKKSCSLDPMPTSLVVKNIEELLPVITCMVNSSLSSGYFPMAWKEAVVDPRLKKPGQNAAFSNLRPINNLQFVSKITEKAVYDQLNNHMMSSDLYPVLQSAYREGHSTETALLKVQNDILCNMDRQRVTLLVLLDLSAAFDTVDHQVLLNRLEVSFGVTDNALKWFRSYLLDRSQRVLVNGVCSDRFVLSQGVPQGSCLGPLLFNIYVSKLFEIIKNHLPDAHAYADDTQLYLSFKPDSAMSEFDAVHALQSCIKDIKTWMTVDKLRLNEKKTEFIVIGSRAQLSKVNISELTIGQTCVSKVTSVRNIGAWFDENLKMTTHINKICQSVLYHLHNIRRIRKFMNYGNRKSLVQAVIMSRIDYCNGLLFGASATHLLKLQRVQNTAARLVCYVPKHDHITPTLIQLHWLPVKYRILFKIAILVHKCISGLAPKYLSSLIEVRKILRYKLKSNGGILLLDKSAKTKKTLGHRAFSNAAPNVWNSLPTHIRNEKNFNIF